jgi:hypothetical protein
MGPINIKWFKDRGINCGESGVEPETNWAGGRIDVYGTDDHYGEELGLPIMRADSYNSFSKWLDTITTMTKVSFNELVEMYYKDGYGKIIFAHDVFEIDKLKND